MTDSTQLRRLPKTLFTPLSVHDDASSIATGSAIAPSLIPAGVGLIVGMSTRAMGFACGSRCIPFTTSDVFLSGNRLKMLRVTAAAHSAQVVQVKTLRNWANQQFIHNTMNQNRAARIRDTPIPLLYLAGPKPAGFRLIHTIPQPIRDRKPPSQSLRDWSFGPQMLACGAAINTLSPLANDELFPALLTNTLNLRKRCLRSITITSNAAIESHTSRRSCRTSTKSLAADRARFEHWRKSMRTHTTLYHTIGFRGGIWRWLNDGENTVEKVA